MEPSSSRSNEPRRSPSPPTAGSAAEPPDPTPGSSESADQDVADMSSVSGTDDLSLDDDDEDHLFSYDPTPSHNPYPAPKWFSVKELQAREIGCQAVS